MSHTPAKKHKRSGSVKEAVQEVAKAISKPKKKMNHDHGKFQSTKKAKPEKKNFDTTAAIAAFQPNGTAVLVPINLVPSGNTGSSAIGREMIQKSVHVRMNVTVPAASAPHACRLLCVYDRSPNGALPAATQVVAATDGACALMALANSDRFSVIFDEKFVVDPQGPQYVWVDRFTKISLKSHALGNAFTGGIAGVQEGAIYLLALSEGAVSPGPTITEMATRIRFYDA